MPGAIVEVENLASKQGIIVFISERVIDNVFKSKADRKKILAVSKLMRCIQRHKLSIPISPESDNCNCNTGNNNKSKNLIQVKHINLNI